MTDAVIEAMVRAILLSVFGVAAERDDERDAETIAADAARAAYLAGKETMRAAVAAEVRGECAKVADAVAENMRSLCAHYRKGGMPQFATESLLQQRTAEAIAATIRAG